MTTKEVERGRSKCVLYWPEQKGDIKRFGDTVVEHRSETLTADYSLKELLVNYEGEECDENGSDQDEGRLIWLYQYRTWPDHGNFKLDIVPLMKKIPNWMIKFGYH